MLGRTLMSVFNFTKNALTSVAVFAPKNYIRSKFRMSKELMEAAQNAKEIGKEEFFNVRTLFKDKIVDDILTTAFENSVKSVKSGKIVRSDAEREADMDAAFGLDDDFAISGGSSGGGDDFSVDTGDGGDDFSFNTDEDGGEIGGIVSDSSTINKKSTPSKIAIDKRTFINQGGSDEALTAGTGYLQARTMVATSMVMNKSLGRLGEINMQQLSVANTSAGTLEKIFGESKATREYQERALLMQSGILEQLQEINKGMQVQLGTLGIGLDGQKLTKPLERNYDKELFSANGEVNFGAYIKSMTAGFKDNVEMVDMMRDILTHPLELATEMVVEGYIPQRLKESFTRLDTTMGNMAHGMFAKFQDWADAPEEVDAEGNVKLKSRIKGVVGRFLSPRASEGSISTAKALSSYEKGAIPFDGVTKKAIVDVIPKHLAEIANLLRGGSRRDEKVFDYNKGTFTTVGEVVEQANRERKNITQSGSFGDLKTELAGMIGTQTPEQKRAVEAQIDRYLQRLSIHQGTKFGDVSTEGLDPTIAQAIQQKMSTLSSDRQMSILRDRNSMRGYQSDMAMKIASGLEGGTLASVLSDMRPGQEITDLSMQLEDHMSALNQNRFVRELGGRKHMNRVTMDILRRRDQLNENELASFQSVISGKDKLDRLREARDAGGIVLDDYEYGPRALGSTTTPVTRGKKGKKKKRGEESAVSDGTISGLSLKDDTSLAREEYEAEVSRAEGRLSDRYSAVDRVKHAVRSIPDIIKNPIDSLANGLTSISDRIGAFFFGKKAVGKGEIPDADSEGESTSSRGGLLGRFGGWMKMSLSWLRKGFDNALSFWKTKILLPFTGWMKTSFSGFKDFLHTGISVPFQKNFIAPFKAWAFGDKSEGGDGTGFFGTVKDKLSGVMNALQTNLKTNLLEPLHKSFFAPKGEDGSAGFFVSLKEGMNSTWTTFKDRVSILFSPVGDFAKEMIGGWKSALGIGQGASETGFFGKQGLVYTKLVNPLNDKLFADTALFGKNGKLFGEQGFFGKDGALLGKTGLLGQEGLLGRGLSSIFGADKLFGSDGKLFGKTGLFGQEGSLFGKTGFFGTEGRLFGKDGIFGKDGRIGGAINQLFGEKGFFRKDGALFGKGGHIDRLTKKISENIFAPAKEWFQKELWEPFSGFVQKEIWNPLSDKLKNFGKQVLEPAKQWFQQSVMAPAQEWLTKKVWEPFKAWSSDLMKNFGEKVIAPFKSFLTTEIWDPFKKTMQEDWVKVKKWGSENFIKPLKGVFDPFLTEFKLAVGGLKTWFVDDFWKKGVIGGIKDVGAYLDETWGTVMGQRFSDMIRENVLNPMKDTLKKIKDGIFGILGSIIKFPVTLIAGMAKDLRAKHTGMGLVNEDGSYKKVSWDGKLRGEDRPDFVGPQLPRRTPGVQAGTEGFIGPMQPQRTESIQTGDKNFVGPQLPSGSAPSTGLEAKSGNSTRVSTKPESGMKTALADIQGDRKTQAAAASSTATGSKAAPSMNAVDDDHIKSIVKSTVSEKEIASSRSKTDEDVDTSVSSLVGVKSVSASDAYSATVATKDTVKKIYSFMLKHLSGLSNNVYRIAKKMGADTIGTKGLAAAGGGERKTPLGMLKEFIMSPFKFLKSVAGSVLRGIGKGILGVTSGVFSGVKNTLGAAVKSIKGIFIGIRKTISGIGDALEMTFKGIKLAFKVLPAILKFRKVITEALKPFQSLINVVISLGKNLFSGLTPVIKTVAKGFITLTKSTYNLTSAVIKTTAAVIGAAGRFIGGMFRRVFGLKDKSEVSKKKGIMDVNIIKSIPLAVYAASKKAIAKAKLSAEGVMEKLGLKSRAEASETTGASGVMSSLKEKANTIASQTQKRALEIKEKAQALWNTRMLKSTEASTGHLTSIKKGFSSAWSMISALLIPAVSAIASGIASLLGFLGFKKGADTVSDIASKWKDGGGPDISMGGGKTPKGGVPAKKGLFGRAFGALGKGLKTVGGLALGGGAALAAGAGSLLSSTNVSARLGAQWSASSGKIGAVHMPSTANKVVDAAKSAKDKFVGFMMNLRDKLPDNMKKHLTSGVMNKIVSKIGGSTIAKAVSRLATGPIGLAITAGSAAYNAWNSYNNADEIMGVTEKHKPLGVIDKLRVGVAGAISDGLTFGLVDTDWLARIMGVEPQLKEQDKKGTEAPNTMGISDVKDASSTVGVQGAPRDLDGTGNGETKPATVETKDQGFFAKAGSALSSAGSWLADKLGFGGSASSSNETANSKAGSAVARAGNKAAGDALAGLPNLNEVGSVIAKYESGNKGVAMVSSGMMRSGGRQVPDPGGVSYGSYQLASRAPGGKWEPSAVTFARENADAFPELAGKTPGTPAFSAAWKEIARTKTDALKQAERNYVMKYLYGPASKRWEAAGFDPKRRSYQEMVWSAGVQFGPGGFGKLLRRLASAGINSSSEPSEVIRKFYDERAASFPPTAQRCRQEVNDILALEEKFGSKSELADKKAAPGDVDLTGNKDNAVSEPKKDAAATASSDGDRGGEGNSSANPSVSADTASATAAANADTSGWGKGSAAGDATAQANAEATNKAAAGARSASSSGGEGGQEGGSGSAATANADTASLTSKASQWVDWGSSDKSGLQTDFAGKLAAAARDYSNATGKKVPVTSAFRSNDKQAELWVRGNKLHERGIYMPAKPRQATTISYAGKRWDVPGSGSSKPGHLTGEAVDVSTSVAADFERYTRKYGIGRPWAQKDPPHFQLLNKSDAAGIQPDTVNMEVAPKTPPKESKDIAANAEATEKAAKAAESKSGGEGGAGESTAAASATPSVESGAAVSQDTEARATAAADRATTNDVAATTGAVAAGTATGAAAAAASSEGSGMSDTALQKMIELLAVIATNTGAIKDIKAVAPNDSGQQAGGSTGNSGGASSAGGNTGNDPYNGTNVSAAFSTYRDKATSGDPSRIPPKIDQIARG